MRQRKILQVPRKFFEKSIPTDSGMDVDTLIAMFETWRAQSKWRFEPEIPQNAKVVAVAIDPWVDSDFILIKLESPDWDSVPQNQEYPRIVMRVV
jgi:hypothetical protein